MAKTIEENAPVILSTLVNQEPDKMGHHLLSAKGLQEATKLSPAEINDAVSILEDSGYVETLKALGSAPFLFVVVTLTSRGKYEYERLSKETKETKVQAKQISIPVSPVGSPFGFTDGDWEFVSGRKSESKKIHVVFGFQFESEFYNTEMLKQNVKSMFDKALEKYNETPGAIQVELNFIPLRAGYGEHLFNEIARDIISADIAVFEASDLNPNVMIEMGVALTWGVRVLPIKEKSSPESPSDISGQTWAKYENSASKFEDLDHERKLISMVERAARKKIG